ncbi:MAG: RHS repeat-associated core domain-containing protein [Candidatus Omnitrophota bacterium]
MKVQINAATVPVEADGTVAEIIDRNNNRLTFTYDALGKLPLIGIPLYTKDPLTPRLIAYQYLLTKITDSVGREINLTYDERGRLVKLTDFSGRDVIYGYDQSGNLISVTDPAGNITQYSYDADRNLHSITDPRGNTYLTNTYNSQDQLVSQTYGGNTLYFNYSPGTTQFTDAKGNIWNYQFDAQGNIVGTYDPSGNFTSKTYDDNGKMLLTSVTYPKLNSLHYEYDEKRNVTKVIHKPKPGSSDPDIVTTYTYEPNYNFIKTITDPKGNVTTYDYDSQGNLIQITYPQVNGIAPITTFTYNQYGQIETVTEPKGITTKYAYDQAAGYLSEITSDFGDTVHLNITTQFVYDTVGNVTSVTDAQGRVTSFTYDFLNQPTVVRDALSNLTRYTYDKNSNLIKLEKQANEAATEWQTTEYEYDILDQLTRIKQNLTQDTILTTQFQYDANGNRTKVIDAEGKQTTYLYDERDLLYNVTDALNSVTEYNYDLNTNLEGIKDAQGNVTSYAYDDFERLIKTTYADNSTEEYTYDSNSNLLTKRTRKGDTITYAYDVLNRLTGKLANEQTITYAYDVASRLTEVADSAERIAYSYDNLNRVIQTDSTLNAIRYTLNYEYDKSGNRTKLTYPDNSHITYAYDSLNRLTNIQDQVGASIASYTYDLLSRRTGVNLSNNTQTAYSYDNSNRLLNIVNEVNAGADISSFAYSYDKAGNRKSKTSTTGTENYSYDAIYQLTSVTNGTTTNYAYDKLGNRTTAEEKTYVSNTLNQYTKVSEADLTYDANGNLTNHNGWTYTYDYENRLISATNGTTTAAYTYDPFGRRIQKEVTQNSQLTTQNYIYDGDQVIAEYDSSGNLQKKYIYGSGIDEPIQGLSPQGTVPEWFYHYDGLGSVTELTDSSGNVVEQYAYDAFGKTTIKDAAGNTLTASAMSNRFMFTGRELDAETGLYHYRARAYSPDLGRFLQTDPVGYTDSMNLYQYCGNNGVNYTDPYGLCKEFFKGMGWGALKTAAVMAGTAAGVALLIVAFPVLVPVLTVAAPWLLGMGAFFGGTQIGLSIGGLDWGGQRLSARQRGEALGTGLISVGTALYGAGKIGGPKSNIQQNKIRGDAFRDEIANNLSNEGLNVKTEVVKNTPFGKRVIDIEVSNEGKVLGGIETKTGESPYTSSQRAKDTWLQLVENYIVNLVRDK